MKLLYKRLGASEHKWGKNDVKIKKKDNYMIINSKMIFFIETVNNNIIHLFNSLRFFSLNLGVYELVSSQLKSLELSAG